MATSPMEAGILAVMFTAVSLAPRTVPGMPYNKDLMRISSKWVIIKCKYNYHLDNQEGVHLLNWEPCNFFFFFFFLLFVAVLTTYGGYQARGPVGVTAAGLLHSHSNAIYIWAPSATYTTAHGNARSLTHWARPGIKPTISWFLVGFVNHWAMMGTPVFDILKRNENRDIPFPLVACSWEKHTDTGNLSQHKVIGARIEVYSDCLTCVNIEKNVGVGKYQTSWHYSRVPLFSFLNLEHWQLCIVFLTTK